MLHRESVLQQSFFNKWRHKLSETLLEADKLNQAQYHYVWTVGCRAWNAWRFLVFQRKDRFVYNLNEKNFIYA